MVSRRKVRDFYEATPERRQHAPAFENWFKLARRAHWHSFQDARATFGQADVARGQTGRTATIFDIGGNKYRIAARAVRRFPSVLSPHYHPGIMRRHS